MVHGEWTATMTFNPVATDVLTVTCGGVTKTYTAVSTDPDTGEFVPGADIKATCALLAPNDCGRFRCITCISYSIRNWICHDSG